MDPDGDYDGRQYTPDNAPTVLVAAPLPRDARPPSDDSDSSSDDRSEEEYYMPPEPTLARPYRPRDDDGDDDDYHRATASRNSNRYIGDVVAGTRMSDSHAAAAPSKTEKRPEPAVHPPRPAVKSSVPQQRAQHQQASPPSPPSPPRTLGRPAAPAPPRRAAPQPAAARPGMKKIPIETIHETIDENGIKTIHKSIRYEYVPTNIDQPAPQPAPAMDRGCPQQPRQPPPVVARPPKPASPDERASSSTRPTTQQRQPTNDDHLAVLIPRALNGGHDHRYSITAAAPGVLYQIQDGDLCMNIWCGCFAQYYAFDIRLQGRQQVLVESTVPCGGFWGGAIGVSKNNAEKRRVQQVLQSQVFADRQVILQ